MGVNLKKLIVFSLPLILLFLSVQATTDPKTTNNTTGQSEAPSSVEPEASPAISSGKSRILFTGETFWGRRIQTYAEDAGRTSFPFEQLSDFNRQDYDAWHSHLECPVSNTYIPIQVQEDELLFNCQPKYLEEYAKYFDIVSLSNNHTDNVGGEQGLLETRSHLEAAGVDHYGHYDNSNLNQICEVVPTPFNLSDGSKAGLPIAYCGYHNVFRLPTDEEIAVIEDFSEHFFTVISPQMGAEYELSADNLKTQTYRAMIDAGADLVVASHPHWVQNTEVYNDKLIMYSIGNFLFDQEWSADVKRGVALDLTLLIDSSEALPDQLDLASECNFFGDSCLAQARSMNLEKPKFELEFDLVFSEYGLGQTKVASDATRQALLDRTNWQETLNQLN